MRRLLSLAVVLPLLALCFAAETPAEDGLGDPPLRKGPSRNSGLMREQMSYLAFDVKAFLMKEGKENAVALGAITGPAQYPTGAGTGLVQCLKEELERVGVKVTPEAKLALNGTYRPVEEEPYPRGRTPDDKELVGAVRVNLEQADGKVLHEFKAATTDAGELATLFGLTFVRKPGGGAKGIGGGGAQPFSGGGSVRPSAVVYTDDDRRNSNEAARKNLLDPKVVIAGSRVKAAEKSPFAIEVLVKDEDGKLKPRLPVQENGRAYVTINRGEVYAVRLTNNAPYEAAVEVSVDGLNNFTFSDNYKSRRWIVKPGAKTTVKGWHRNKEETNEFLITEYAKGVVALTGADPAGVGTITARFHASWTKNGRPPADEPKERPSYTVGSMKDDATGQGKKIRVKTRTVQREVGVVRAVVTIRYRK